MNCWHAWHLSVGQLRLRLRLQFQLANIWFSYQCHFSGLSRWKWKRVSVCVWVCSVCGIQNGQIQLCWKVLGLFISGIGIGTGSGPHSRTALAISANLSAQSRMNHGTLWLPPAAFYRCLLLPRAADRKMHSMCTVQRAATMSPPRFAVQKV